MSGLDARLRRLFAAADTSPGFEARVHARVAALEVLPAADLLAAADLRARAEHRRELEQRRLRRDAWLNGVIAAGIGGAGVALVLRHGATVSRWAGEFAAVASDPSLTTGIVLAMISLGLWPLLRRSMTR